MVDEHWAEHSWAFNSFSRSVEGVLSVLNFYACAEGCPAKNLAKKDAHVLVLVARLGKEGGGRWAYPVQLFAGGEFSFPASVEQEVLVPPFTRYVFEAGVEASSSQSEEERTSRLQSLEQRWALQLSEEAPGLSQLLAGEVGHRSGFVALGRSPRVTVRFVRQMEPAYPMRELLSAAVQDSPTSARRRLLNFPRPAHLKPQAQAGTRHLPP
eukprot:TRINITY_DN77440_c0_g1_i1.p1 TRINITY_DN77440_c0_g1~~TRINITY_DN77440_c0_g1_i1.p1  ORF type:complete len:211 (-),score=39.15 TRINITY_DN77440_c0_g1_i1:15-647(-)